MSEYPLIGLRQFREKLDSIKEPVRVVKTRGDITVLGVWIPASYGAYYTKPGQEASIRDVSSTTREDSSG